MLINFRKKSLISEYKTKKSYKKIPLSLVMNSLITFLTITFIKTKAGDVLGGRFRWFFRGIKSTLIFWTCSKFTVKNKNFLQS